MIDRELYLPKSWTDDPERCAAAGIPRTSVSRPNPRWPGHARPGAGRRYPGAWVAGDEVYGADPGLRAELELRGLGYVLAMPPATGCPPRRAPARRRAHRPPAPPGLAAATPRARAPKATATTTGPGWPSTPGPTRSPVAAGAPQPTHQGAGVLPLLQPPPGRAARAGPIAGRRWTGGEYSRPAKAWPGWTSTRSAAGTPGTAGPPCRHARPRPPRHHRRQRAHRPAAQPIRSS